ncbi:MAG TPA: 50S ribosomal protein L11 methyltransferase [Nitrospirales bacterium]|nr:50S ribosomal protein L11 methyltransferase [Nitrospirales bacterium]
MSRLLNEHRHYLADGVRLEAFARSIGEVVRPGDVVVDLGAGTGILGLMACRAGAARVYAIDDGGMIEVARELADANAYGDRIVHLKGHSTEVELPERADVVLADQIGHFGIEAGVLQYFADARRRFLKPGGRFLPRRLELNIAAVEYPEADDLVGFWQRSAGRFDVSPVHTLAANSTYSVTMSARHLLSDGSGLAAFELGEPHEQFHADAMLSIHRPGMLHGLVGYFAASLSPSVQMTNSPAATDRIERSQLFLPIDRPIAVKDGDSVRVSLAVRPADVMMAWNVTVAHGADTTTFRHSTLQGAIMAREDLQRTNPSHAPLLTAHGEAAQTVLSLCTGTVPVREIEERIATRFPMLFRTHRDAAAFVASLLSEHAR